MEVEERRFDDLSRCVGELTSPLPRRGLVRLLGGATLAGALGLAAGADARQDTSGERKKKKGKNGTKKQCKADGKKCKKSKDCCDSKCQDGRCGESSSKCGTRVRFNTRWGTRGSGDNQFRTPWGIATDRNGNVYVTDSGNSRIQVFGAGGSFIREWGSRGSGTGNFQEPRGIGVNVESGSKFRVFVADPDNSNSSRRLRKFSTSGAFLESMERSGLSRPRGVAIDADNNVWVVDRSSTGKIFLFDRSGNFITSWTPSGSGELSSPEGIAVFEDRDNRTYVYVTSTGNNRVFRYEYTGNNSSGLKFIKSAGSQGSGSSSFNNPAGVAVDKCGNVWVADRLNDRLQQLDKNLTFKSRVTASFSRPSDVAISPNGKSLYVVDSDNDLIQRFDLES